MEIIEKLLFLVGLNVDMYHLLLADQLVFLVLCWEKGRWLKKNEVPNHFQDILEDFIRRRTYYCTFIPSISQLSRQKHS